MHMADMLVSPSIGIAMYIASISTMTIACRKLKQMNDERKVPFMGVVGAFIFAAQMINFSIPGTGSSGHLCGGLLAAALLGPYEGFLVMAAILTVQCLLFADGGLLALGCNIWNMAFYSCLLSWFCIFHPIVRKKITKRRLFTASIFSSIVSLQLGAGSVVIETLLSDVTELPMYLFFTAMQPIHLAIGLVEGVVTGAILCFIFESRPEILNNNDTKFNLKPAIITFAITALLLSGGLSLFASENPDGLEWSLEKAGIEKSLSEASTVSSTLQETIAIFPDYTVLGTESAFYTSIAGIFGSFLTIFSIVLTSKIFRFRRKKAKTIHEPYT